MWRQLILGVSLVINAVLFYTLVWGDHGLSAYQSLKDEQRNLIMRIKELDDRNLSLSREIRLLQSDEKYLEKVIRRRLNLVKDNEILYIFPGVHDTAKTGAGPDETKN
jgi:cell division protein FtsB